MRAALKDFHKAIELLPIADAAYLERGRLFYFRYNIKEAIIDFTKAIELNPFNSEAYNWRGDAREPAVDSVTDFSKAIELSPNNGRYYINRGLAFSIAGQKKESSEDWNKAIALFTYDVEKGIKKPCELNPYIERGYVYGRLKRYEDALQDLNIAIRDYPDYYRGYLHRAIVFSKQQKYEKSISDFTRSIELNPNFAFNYENRACDYDKIGQKEKAESDRKKVKELRTTVPGAQPDQ